MDINLNCLLLGVLGKGNQIKFWTDTWVAEEPLKDKYPLLFALEQSKGVLVNECFRMCDRTIVWAWRWKREIAPGRESNDLAHLLMRLLNVEPSDCNDSWRWCDAEVKEFSSSYIKAILANKCDDSEAYNFPWNNWVPRKVNILNWRAELNRIPTLDSLRRRNISVASDHCVLCGAVDESVHHMFTSCAFSMKIWESVSQKCNIGHIYAFSFRDLMDSPYQLRGDDSFKKAIHAILMVAVWCIWKHRNEILFKEVHPSVGKVMSDINVAVALWVKERSKGKEPLVVSIFLVDPG